MDEYYEIIMQEQHDEEVREIQLREEFSEDELEEMKEWA